MRLFLALILCKLIRAALRVLGRGGTALPGKVALRICPDLLDRLSKDVKVIMLTGTNGKTTTSRMVEQMLSDAGIVCFANRSGSNLERGIAADFAENARLSGAPRKKYAVIECDEAAFRTVCGRVKPAVAVVTNLFRDQLDRYGEITNTLANIREGLEKSPETVMCLNADCSLTASLALDLPNEARFFGMDAELGGKPDVSDAPRCIRCGESYEYSYHTFAHLGGFRCPRCGYTRREPDVAVESITESGQRSVSCILRVDGIDRTAVVALPGTYNLYNAAAAVTAAMLLGVECDGAIASLAGVSSGFGRMETFELGSVPITMILVKNPAGCDRALDYLASLGGGTLAVLCLNDNIADGTDISWIWDTGFERLFDGGDPPRFIVSGTRAEDMRLRLKYAGADENAVRLLRSTEQVVEAMAQSELPVCVLPTYTAMLPLRAELSRLTGRKEFWE